MSPDPRAVWRLMLAVNAVVLIGVFLSKIRLPPYSPYIHLLVDYHFGFVKRALIGALTGLFVAKVPVWAVFAIAGTAWLITAGLFVHLFRRTFTLSDDQRPLFVFMAGSPFFLKNFMHTLGHFDIYGCLFAIGLLLAPARSPLFVLLAALASVVLVLIHHVQLLEYVPTIAVIVMLRHYLVVGITRPNLAIGIGALVGLGALFVAVQFYGTMPIPEAEFIQYLQGRMADPARTEFLGFSFIWYQSLAMEFHDTWERLPWNLLGFPVYAVLIWLHAPLWQYFAAMIGALAHDRQRQLVIAAITAVSLGYLVIFATVFDYSRWLSNWVVCLFLIMHAVKHLPSAKVLPPIPAGDQRTRVFGWLITLIPRVGIVRPF